MAAPRQVLSYVFEKYLIALSHNDIEQEENAMFAFFFRRMPAAKFHAFALITPPPLSYPLLPQGLSKPDSVSLVVLMCSL